MSKFFHCKKCGYRVNPGEYGHPYNVVAIENGYCSFGCLMGDVGIDEAFRLYDEHKKRMHGKQERT